MPYFRPSSAHCSPPVASPPVGSFQAIRALVKEVLEPGNFFLANGLCLEWDEVVAEEVPWELFRGRLLPSAQTHQRRIFEAWNGYRVQKGTRAEQPLLSVKLDTHSGELHVTRAIYSRIWEGYDAGNNVFLSRESQGWVQELVGTIQLEKFSNGQTLRDELVCRLFQAVVGTSRLPLTSLEAPLPEFTFGQLAYCYRALSAAISTPMHSPEELGERALDPNLGWQEYVKILEALIRATPVADLAAVAARFSTRWRDLDAGPRRLPALLRDLFNDVALSPYTDFVPKALAFVESLESIGGLSADEHIDFLSYLLRQFARHLTAFDLVRFHHKGANYPDILALDLVLKAFIRRAQLEPEHFAGSTGPAEAARRRQIRRRALRQGWMLRRRYEGYLVPDAPTSPGENVRILPEPFARVSDEQITNPSTREKRLFADDPIMARLNETGARILRASIADLQLSEELRELGMALFLDRPLGVFKQAGEPDQTPLLSYEAFSPSIADGRLQYLAGELGIMSGSDLARYRALLHEVPTDGLAITRQTMSRATVSVQDAFRVADDFMFLRTTPRSARHFWQLFDFPALGNLVPLDRPFPCLILEALAVGEAEAGGLAVFDARDRRRLELRINMKDGYESRGGIEYPAAGLELRLDSNDEENQESNWIAVRPVREF